MADRRKLITSLAITLGLLALNLVAFNVLLAGFGRARVDLTEDRLYSISEATRRVLESLDQDAVIYGYFSRRTHPKLAPLVPRLEDLLDEYRALSRGRVKVEIVDPGENETVAQEARDRFGVTSTPFRLASKYETGIVNAYFALVVKYGDQYVRYGFDDLIQVEPLPDGEIDVRLSNPEYDLTRALKKVVFGFRGATELFERIEGPVRFTAVMTPGTLPEVFADVPDPVRQAAEELAARGGERFVYEELDPTTGEQVALEARQRFGVRPMSLGFFGDREFYLYGFLEAGGELEQVILTAEDVSGATVREAIEDSLRRRTPGFLKTVGVVAPDPSIPPEIMMQLQMQGRMPPQPPPEFEQVKRYLERDYRVEDVDLGSGPVPTDVDVLLVLKPRDLEPQQIYRLDQYLMRGGRVVLCAGNYEADFDQSGLRVAPVETGLHDWLAHLGVTIPETLVLDDRNQALPIPELVQTALGTMRSWRMEPYPYLVEVRDDGLASREITARLAAVGLYWASPIEVDPERTAELGLEARDLLRSSDRSWTDDDLSRVMYVDYEVPQEGTGPRALAVALEGRFRSFWAGQQPPGAGAEDGAGEAAPPAEVPLEESPETRLVVVGNAEFLSDFVAQALGRQEGGFFAENLAFTQNVIDWTNLDSDMAAIRSRAAGARRLERTERAGQVTVETGNYLVLAVVVLALAAWRVWRRRGIEPVVVARAPRRTET